MSDSKAVFLEIAFGSEAYRQECDLRQEILRKPLGLNLYAEDLRSEATQLHFGLFADGNLLASVIAAPTSATEVRLRQMAVTSAMHKQGLGRMLLGLVEIELIRRGYSSVWMHARLSALGFYEKLGFERFGDVFLDVGIPHVNMRKRLTRLSD